MPETRVLCGLQPSDMPPTMGCSFAGSGAVGEEARWGGVDEVLALDLSWDARVCLPRLRFASRFSVRRGMFPE